MPIGINDLLGGGGLGGPEGGGSGGTGIPTPTPTPTSTGSAPIPPVTSIPPTTPPNNTVVNILVNGTNAPADVSLVVGQTIIINSQATTINDTAATAPIVYASSDINVVQVLAFDGTGEQASLIGIGVGSAFITVSSTNPDGTGAFVRFRVNVIATTATEVSRKVVPASKNMSVGDIFQFSVEITYTDGSKNTITHGQWSSGAGSITTEGVLTATNVGTWTVDSPGATGASVIVSNSAATTGVIAMQPSQLNVDYVLDSFVAPPSQTVTLTNTSIDKQAQITFSTADASITVTPNTMTLLPGENGKVVVSFTPTVLNAFAEGAVDEIITLNLFLTAAQPSNIPPPTPTPPVSAPIPTQGGTSSSGGSGAGGAGGGIINGGIGLGGIL